MKKSIRSIAAVVPTARQVAPSVSRPFHTTQAYASSNSLGTTGRSAGPKRRTVTAFNDDGNVPWNELSSTEKASRATQQTYNFGMIIIGLVLTVRRIYHRPKDHYLKTANSDRARAVLRTFSGRMSSRQRARQSSLIGL